MRSLSLINLSSKSKAEFEFFKMYFRGHLAQSFEQGKNSKSDFVSIGKAFHRWVRDSEKALGLKEPHNFIDFMERLQFFSEQYVQLHTLIEKHRTDKDYLYLVINNDFGFTLQPAVILSSICYGDDLKTIKKKIQIVSKHLTKVLVSRVWNHYSVAQSAMEKRSYDLCVKLRNKTPEELIEILKQDNDENWSPNIENTFPTLNQQNRRRIKVLLLLLTAIVSINSDTQLSIMDEDSLEIEHIWSDHYELHKEEFSSEPEFSNVRNKIGDLLLLPKSFNASYGDATYEEKVVQYFQQNILARTLNKNQYKNNPQFLRFKEKSDLKFKPYSNNEFTSQAINERTNLYREILKWTFNENNV